MHETSEVIERGKKVMSNMTCYILFEKVYADHDYIRNVLIISVYM